MSAPQQKYTYTYSDQPQQTFTVQTTNLPAANGVFHLVTPLRWQPPTTVLQDHKVSHPALVPGGPQLPRVQ